ncbi:hypothetical protein Nepgr_032150 [Nepenthes gracilis]|uniref:Uncharacterized protein n=1 Tax=Nepenthes gracilis TaxID=150966 RepID=A0AAD3TIW9_NEPGR|nr:hypothetical protein Nepgr_032150 [Nepenthes gracilis]
MLGGLEAVLSLLINNVLTVFVYCVGTASSLPLGTKKTLFWLPSYYPSSLIDDHVIWSLNLGGSFST